MGTAAGSPYSCRAPRPHGCSCQTRATCHRTVKQIKILRWCLSVALPRCSAALTTAVMSGGYLWERLVQRHPPVGCVGHHSHVDAAFRWEALSEGASGTKSWTWL